MRQAYRHATNEEELAAIRKEPGAKAQLVKTYTPRYDGTEDEFEFGLPPSYLDEEDAWRCGAARVIINKVWVVEEND